MKEKNHLTIRAIQSSDAALYSDYYSRNLAHFKPWSPIVSADYHNHEQWQQRIDEYLEKQRTGTAAYFVLLDENDDKIVAHCTLSQIFYGPFRACYMGYGIDQNYQGKGLMPALCQHVIDYAFNTLKLHRIMANYMPHNNRSAALLKQLGFVKEGLAKDYLEINGRWENHILSSLTNNNIKHL